MANKNFDFEGIERRFREAIPKTVTLAANDAVNFFKDSFERQGWLGNTMQPWKPRKEVTRWGQKSNNKGKSILVQSGRLKRSIRVVSKSGLSVIIGTDVPYAKAHNEGVRLGIIQNVKQYSRKKTKFGINGKKQLKNRTNISFGRVTTGETIVSPHKRRINQNIPRRQFMGNSPYLTSKIKARITQELLKALR